MISHRCNVLNGLRDVCHDQLKTLNNGRKTDEICFYKTTQSPKTYLRISSYKNSRRPRIAPAMVT